jgi:hypothetical protein
MNSNIKNEIDNEWETDEEETQFLRLNIENASKIKHEIYKRKKYHNKKIKRLEKKEIESANEIEKYIKNNILSKIIIKTDINNNKPYLSIGENDFLINDKPEVGTNVFFSYNEDKRKLEILGKSERFFEAKILKAKKRIFPKKNPPIKKQKINIQKLKKNKNNNSGDIDTEIDTSKKSDNEMIKNKNNINKNIKMIGNKRKRKPKRKYIKESTIINIKKIE